MAIKKCIQAAMQRIAKRRTGKSKLVYDKATRTIVKVSDRQPPVKVLDISDQEADMFSAETGRR